MRRARCSEGALAGVKRIPPRLSWQGALFTRDIYEKLGYVINNHSSQYLQLARAVFAFKSAKMDNVCQSEASKIHRHYHGNL